MGSETPQASLGTSAAHFPSHILLIICSVDRYLFEPDFKHLRHEAFLDNCTADHRSHYSLTSQAWHVDMELSRMPISYKGAARRRGAVRAFGKSWVSCGVP